MKCIILLKNKTVPQDQYADVFQASGFRPAFLPLLKHTAMNEELILKFLKSKEFINEYKALIITSQRCIETLDIIIRKLRTEKFSCLNDILKKPSYTVGPATARVLKKLGFKDIRGGEEAGNGAILSDIIINDNIFDHSDSRKILFLTGKIRKDTIPKKLREAGFQMKELVSYKTEPYDDIMKRYCEVLSTLDQTEDNWLVFFSPQGTEDILNRLCNDTTLPFNLATIGPTTEHFLRMKGIKTDVVSKKPNAKMLYESITEASKYKFTHH